MPWAPSSSGPARAAKVTTDCQVPGPPTPPGPLAPPAPCVAPTRQTALELRPPTLCPLLAAAPTSSPPQPVAPLSPWRTRSAAPTGHRPCSVNTALGPSWPVAAHMPSSSKWLQWLRPKEGGGGWPLDWRRGWSGLHLRTLTVRAQAKVRHYRFSTTADGSLCLQKGYPFPSLEELLVYKKAHWELIQNPLLWPCVPQVDPSLPTGVCGAWEPTHGETSTLVGALPTAGSAL